MKKKKRIDPAVIRNREERKRKKIEKTIRRLEKNARQLKPIGELEVPFKLVDEKKFVPYLKINKNISIYLKNLIGFFLFYRQRIRKKQNLSPEILEERILLTKEWSRYKSRQHIQDMQMIETITLSQQKALDELRIVSEDLYQAAIQPDLNLIPYVTKGPVHTIAIPNYIMPDGDYIDVTRKFDGEDQQQPIQWKKTK